MKTFHGGIHPAEHKNTRNLSIADLVPPKELIIPVAQHIGTPAVPCVKTGEAVLAGQKIAKAYGFVSANVHSPVSGIVTAIEKRMHPSGIRTECIIIENDGKYIPYSRVNQPETDYSTLSPEEIISRIQESGIVGMGGAAFPTHVKMSPPDEAKIDYIILNGSECEPFLTSDHRIMLETPADIITGLAVIMQIFGLSDGYIGIESNKPDAIRTMRLFADRFHNGNIHIIPLKTKYPQGAEKQLIYAVTKRKVKSGQLPWQAGCIVSNVSTAAAIKHAVVDNLPLTSRVITVCGDAVKNQANYRVPIGTPFSYVLEQSGILSGDIKKVIMGGPMMGIAVPNADVPVIKGTSGILTCGEKYAKLNASVSCINCSKCVYACPMNLQPNILDRLARTNDFDALNKLHISDCLECGSCAYVCPSKRHQVQTIKAAKLKMKSVYTKSERN